VEIRESSGYASYNHGLWVVTQNLFQVF